MEIYFNPLIVTTRAYKKEKEETNNDNTNNPTGSNKVYIIKGVFCFVSWTRTCIHHIYQFFCLTRVSLSNRLIHSAS